MSEAIWVPMTPEFRDRLTRDWSKPVQVKVVDDVLVFRELVHPVSGTRVDPIDQIWLVPKVDE